MSVSATPPAAATVVYEFAKNGRERIRATLTEYNGHPVADLRVHAPRRADGVFVPTPKGLTVSLASLPELENAVRALRAAAPESPTPETQNVR